MSKYDTAVTLDQLRTCNVCRHVWKPRRKDREPRICPNCKSVRWNDELKELELKEEQLTSVGKPL